MHHVALQLSEISRARFMADISICDPSMLVWLDESGCDRRNTNRKYGYSLWGKPLHDHRLLVRGTRYSAIPIMSLEGIHDVYITEGTVNGDRFAEFVTKCLLTFHHQSVVVMDNASIHHVDAITRLIENSMEQEFVIYPPIHLTLCLQKGYSVR